MRVRCIQRELSIEQFAMLGVDRAHQDFGLTVGKEYLVIGLDFFMASRVFGSGLWLHLVDDDEHLVWVPLCLFQIVDGRVSKHWVARTSTVGFSLWPSALYREFFHDDLSEQKPDAVSEFRKTISALKAEAQS